MDKVSNISIAVDDFPDLIDFAKKTGINLVVPGQFFCELSFVSEWTKFFLRTSIVMSEFTDPETGPEVPLVEGVTDQFKKCNIPIIWDYAP